MYTSYIYIIETNMSKLRLPKNMKFDPARRTNHRIYLIVFVIGVFAVLSNSSIFSNAYGQVYTKSDKPFGVPFSDWISKWWSWWIDVSKYEHPDLNPELANRCLIRSSDYMVMLMETTVASETPQECTISADQGIIVPLWTAFQEDSIKNDGSRPYEKYTNEQMANVTKAVLNLGQVYAEVTVDGKLVAKLDENTELVGRDALGRDDPSMTKTTVNSMQNVIEIWSSPFNISIPMHTFAPDQNTGTFRAGAHGWFTFLKPFTPNSSHSIEYFAKVDGVNAGASKITYNLKVVPE